MNLTSVSTIIADQACARFDTFDLTELRKATKEKSIPTSNIEDVLPSLGRPEACKRSNDQLRSSTPPPVLFKELPIALIVFGIHWMLYENKKRKLIRCR